MTLKLTTPLRREIHIDGEPFTIVVSADGIRLTRKRFRSGRAISWRALWESGIEVVGAPPGSDGPA